METHSNNSIIKLGRGKGYEILNAIKNAKNEVKVVSPYLSPDYIKELIKLHNKGIKITLITCDNLEVNQYSDFKPSDIIKKEKIENKNLKKIKKDLNKVSLILLIISIIGFLISSIFPIIFFIPIIILIITIIIFFINFIIKDYQIIYNPIFRLKIFDSKSGYNPQSTNLIHSKIYLIDNKILYLGSANFTFSAFKTHYETIIKVLDQKAIADINQEIENIYNSKELKEKSYDDLFNNN